jgi:hypothetical protein
MNEYPCSFYFRKELRRDTIKATSMEEALAKLKKAWPSEAGYSGYCVNNPQFLAMD